MSNVSTKGLPGNSRPSKAASPSWRRRIAQIAIPAGGASAGLIALLLVAAPIAAGGSTSTIFTAPYKQIAKIYTSTVTSTGCHAYANDPVTPSVDVVNGIIKSWQRSVAGNCNSGTVWASTYTNLGFNGPKWTAKTSSVNVAVEWSIDWSARATAQIDTTAVASTATSTASLNLGSFVMDTTAGTSLWGTGTNNITLADLSETNGTVLAHSNGAVNYWTNFTVSVSTGDWLVLETELWGQTYDVSSMCDQTAWSQVDLGSGSHAATLVSVTVS